MKKYKKIKLKKLGLYDYKIIFDVLLSVEPLDFNISYEDYCKTLGKVNNNFNALLDVYLFSKE